ncbi:MAG: rRNA methyltransferase [Bacteroidetes bacterium HGW-Bacteroidetes-1]|jgi:TrmH family RNA methyltransferase|nr:MAG: rRNA methyltransferase [Bacteroidetes bacterium HGW-Bacteroidetes-1]
MITSRANQQIKNIIKLQKSSERRSQNLIVIEGLREIERALCSGWKIRTLYVCEALAEKKMNLLEKKINTDCSVEYVSKEVFECIAYREGSDGFLALCNPILLQLEEVKLRTNPILLILEGIEKPGNLGAVMRTADAAGIDAVIVCDPQTDLYNPNIIRASLGCVFALQVIATTSEKAIGWLYKNHIPIFCTSLEASRDYLTTDFTSSCAIVLGTESTGLSDLWIKNANQNICIEMLGIADSLNVSVTAAIVVFEAIRQRKRAIFL